MNTIDKTGGSAFPMVDVQAVHAYAMGVSIHIEDPAEREKAYIQARAQAVGGMTLRDYFAAKAMEQVLAKTIRMEHGSGGIVYASHFAEYAYNMADAMLRARKEGGAE